MNLALIIYLINVLDNIRGTLSVLGGLGCLTAIAGIGICFAFCASELDGQEQADYRKELWKWARITLVVFVVSQTGATLLPAKPVSYAILAAYAGEQLVASDAVQRLAPKTAQLLEKYMDEALAEGGPQ